MTGLLRFPLTIFAACCISLSVLLTGYTKVTVEHPLVKEMLEGCPSLDPKIAVGVVRARVYSVIYNRARRLELKLERERQAEEEEAFNKLWGM